MYYEGVQVTADAREVRPGRVGDAGVGKAGAVPSVRTLGAASCSPPRTETSSGSTSTVCMTCPVAKAMPSVTNTVTIRRRSIETKKLMPASVRVRANAPAPVILAGHV